MSDLLSKLGDFLSQPKEKPPLIIILGPTASGKTGLSVNLAKRFDGEIISADSRQIYRRMDVGTDKISHKEMQGVKHYMLDVCDPDRVYTMADYVREATFSIKDILKKGKIPFIVGGTGLYINAIADNYELDNAPPDMHLRKELEQELEAKGAEALHKMLSELDPLAASKIHPNNHRYLIRALEINLKTNKPKGNRRGEPPYETFKIGIERDRDALYERINARVDEQIDRGILNEIKTLLAEGYDRNLPAMTGLGYKEFFPYLDGESSLDKCLEELKQNTRNYAKRQMTWFRRDDEIYWITPEEADSIHYTLSPKSYQMKTSFQRLIDIAIQLRSDNGCPWDRAQTIESLMEGLEEESGEVLDAVKKGDYENLREELGDLLFQIVMVSQIASEEGLFTMKEVMDDITQKLIDRHSWVFGDDKAETAEEALKKWKENKEKQKKKKK